MDNSRSGAPDFWVTYAQTSLLLAEAAKRGWIPGGDAQQRHIMKMGSWLTWLAYALYPGTTPISAAEIAAYIAHPAVAYNATDALKLINTQYWIVNIRNGTEAFANFRRSWFPALSPNPFQWKSWCCEDLSEDYLILMLKHLQIQRTIMLLDSYWW